jgi:uncharacterized damage-inducible protein DinB
MDADGRAAPCIGSRDEPSFLEEPSSRPTGFEAASATPTDTAAPDVHQSPRAGGSRPRGPSITTGSRRGAMSHITRLIDENLGVLFQGLDVLEQTSDTHYIAPVLGPRGGSIGAQVRHVIDLHVCLLRDMASGRVDYDRRERDPRTEVDRGYAASKLRNLARTMPDLARWPATRILYVRHDDVRSAAEGGWSWSSLARELQFVQSHTIHHYALIGLMLRTVGARVPAELGLAPSTAVHWRQAPPAA